MARLQLDLPLSFLFTTEIMVRVTDINFAGHLGNDNLVSLLQEARTRFLDSYGLPEMDIFGAGMVITDVAVIYESESFRGEVLRIEMTVGDFNKYGCDFFYRISEKTSGREVAKAKTGMVFFDYRQRRVQQVPKEFLELFAGAAG
jgi:acyl-CoA thioester hydrolase